jgi:hypothetical protein
MTTAKRKLSSVLAAVAVLTCQLDNRVLAAPNDADDVRNAVAGFATSWNRHDMDAFGKLFAPDAEFVNVAGVVWRGRQTIQAQHAYSHGVIPADSRALGAAGRCPNTEPTAGGIPVCAHPAEWRVVDCCRSKHGNQSHS